MEVEVAGKALQTLIEQGLLGLLLVLSLLANYLQYRERQKCNTVHLADIKEALVQMEKSRQVLEANTLAVTGMNHAADARTQATAAMAHEVKEIRSTQDANIQLLKLMIEEILRNLRK